MKEIKNKYTNNIFKKIKHTNEWWWTYVTAVDEQLKTEYDNQTIGLLCQDKEKIIE